MVRINLAFFRQLSQHKELLHLPESEQIILSSTEVVVHII